MKFNLLKTISSFSQKHLWLMLAGIIFSLAIYFWNPFHLNILANKTLAVAALMISWWVLEALPMPVVALVPLIFFPTLGIAKLEETSAPYSNSVVYLFMGGFLLGLAIEKWNLHKRIALSILSITGTSGNKIILGFILATGLMSMWLSNTSTTMMMFPIALSVINVMKVDEKNTAGMKNFSLALMLSIAYASNIGGIATIIGTPPNVAFTGFINKKYNTTIAFSDWMLLCTPLSILLLLILYFLLVKVLFPNRILHDTATALFIKQELKKLGSISVPEKRVLIVFVCTAFLWIFKDVLASLIHVKFLYYVGWFFNQFQLNDTTIAVIGAFALFVVPSGKKENTTTSNLLDWEDTSKMAWGILLLFGGGIAMAGALEKAGLITMMGQWLNSFTGSNGFVLILMITIVSVFISEIMSNVAQVIVFAPVIAGIADALKMDPLLLGIPMTLGASVASMLPMGTPPNAIVFSSGYIRLKQMLKAGFVINIIASILIALFCWFILPKVMWVVR